MKQSDLKGLDKKVENIYKYGCYFLDLLYLAKGREPEMVEMLRYYDLFIENDWMEEDCYVKNPCAILKHLTGKSFTIKKDSVFYKDATYVLGYYYNPTTNIHHFVIMNKFNEVMWDSIQNSNTVKNGFIESYRLFYEC